VFTDTDLSWREQAKPLIHLQSPCRIGPLKRVGVDRMDCSSGRCDRVASDEMRGFFAPLRMTTLIFVTALTFHTATVKMLYWVHG